MLLDNKFDYASNNGEISYNVRSVVDFIRKYTSLDSERKGSLDIVTGFFTIAGLDFLYRVLSPDNKYRLILSELTGSDDGMERVIDLLQGDGGIEPILKLNQTAKNALEFLKRDSVEVRTIVNAFCHAKAYIFKDAADDAHDYYVMGSSNLTEAGLGVRDSSNVELNFADTGSTNGEYANLRKWFNIQWNKVAQSHITASMQGGEPKAIEVNPTFRVRRKNTAVSWDLEARSSLQRPISLRGRG